MENDNDTPMMYDVDVTCYTCGQTGDHLPDCPDLDNQ